MATSIALLADRLGRLEQDVVETQKKFDAALRPREVELREIPRAQAKDEVMDFFLDHGRAYPSDAACALRLDALLVVELCDELQGEGLLGD